VELAAAETVELQDQLVPVQQILAVAVVVLMILLQLDQVQVQVDLV
jgi:hypothetical protein